jgi:hypothetical protein
VAEATAPHRVGWWLECRSTLAVTVATWELGKDAFLKGRND